MTYNEALAVLRETAANCTKIAEACNTITNGNATNGGSENRPPRRLPSVAAALGLDD